MSDAKDDLVNALMVPIRAAEPKPPNLIEMMAAAEVAYYQSRGYTVHHDGSVVLSHPAKLAIAERPGHTEAASE